MRYRELLAYTAGIIDGEGHIALFKRQGSSIPRLQVAVTNTNEWLCQWLKMQFGGRVYSWKPFKINWKRAYRWVLEYQEAALFLTKVLPYLNLKKPHAEIAISFQHRRVLGRNRFSEPNILDEADFIRIQQLNKRGL